MTGRLFAFRTDRPWPIALFASVTWLQPWTLMGTTAAWWILTLWGLSLALTALPLGIADPLTFRHTCLAVGGVVLSTQVTLAAPYLPLPPPFSVILFPAGGLLLLAGWKRGGLTRATLAALLLVIPAATAFATLFPPP
ncbi:hypothetical protein [Streptomyces sp. CBMA123]|uniref:hypothetical protein n=1 Tax=Streptomyces sp. CBMA123 TaxID=1896313 RepID=UPI001661AFB6|nr:hypothetical protein [Streptomyces sp. CBMA123]MBD0689597.1 hypothetical protein [Streptomyces sp. CBMA123]